MSQPQQVLYDPYEKRAIISESDIGPNISHLFEARALLFYLFATHINISYYCSNIPSSVFQTPSADLCKIFSDDFNIKERMVMPPLIAFMSPINITTSDLDLLSLFPCIFNLPRNGDTYF